MHMYVCRFQKYCLNKCELKFVFLRLQLKCSSKAFYDLKCPVLNSLFGELQFHPEEKKRGMRKFQAYKVRRLTF